MIKLIIHIITIFTILIVKQPSASVNPEIQLFYNEGTKRIGIIGGILSKLNLANKTKFNLEALDNATNHLMICSFLCFNAKLPFISK